MSRFGPANSNWRGGSYSNYQSLEDKMLFQVPIAREKLRKILTAKCDGAGRLPFTTEEQKWALRICREQPEWAHPVLRELGFEVA